MTKERKNLQVCWHNMKARCLFKHHKNYHQYGGRGIKICEAWLSFERFYQDMLPIYKIGFTIDRIDNNGDYCKENCRWITRQEQNLNKRTNRFITYRGETKTVSQWEKDLGLKRYFLQHRIDRDWDIKDVFGNPFNRNRINI